MTWGPALLAAALIAGGCGPPPLAPPPALDPGILMRAGRDLGFFSLPWPNDIRKNASGGLDTAGMPGTVVDPLDVVLGNRSVLSLALADVVTKAGATVSAFGLSSAVFMQSTVGIDPATLPDPIGSTSPASPVMLMDLDHGGERAPVLVESRPSGNLFRPDNSLIVLPYPGHPLHESSRYALAVFDDVKGAGDVVLEPSPLISTLDDAWTPTSGSSEADWAALREQRDAVRAAVQSTTTRDPASLIAFTVFTTQDAHREMAAVAATVADLAQPTIDVSSTRPCTSPYGDAIVRGTISMPNFQAGTFPYLQEGGSLAIDGSGRAVVQSTLSVPVSLSVPCGLTDTSALPAVGYVNGTGSNGDVATSQKPFYRGDRVVAEIPSLYGTTTLGSLDYIAQQFVSALGINDAALPGLLFFNLFNPVVARTNVFQQAAEQLMLVRALRGFSVEGAMLGVPSTVSVDPARVSTAGHSQGAETLPLVAASDPLIAGVVSSAGSGGVYHQFAHARDKREAMARLTDHIEALDELNPLVHVAQTALEATDGANFPSTVNYLNFAGRADGCVAIESARTFVHASGLASVNVQSPASLYGTASLDPPTLAFPISGNAAGRTRVSYELPGGHFAGMYTLVSSTFLGQVDRGEVPRVDIDPPGGFGALSPECRGRWDEPPARYGE